MDDEFMKGDKQSRPSSLVPSPVKSEVSFDEEDGGVPLVPSEGKLDTEPAGKEEDLIIFDEEIHKGCDAKTEVAEKEEDLIIFDKETHKGCDAKTEVPEKEQNVLSKVEGAIKQLSLVEDEAETEKKDEAPSKGAALIDGTCLEQGEEAKKEKTKEEEKKKPKCRFHPGAVVNKVFNPSVHPLRDLT